MKKNSLVHSEKSGGEGSQNNEETYQINRIIKLSIFMVICIFLIKIITAFFTNSLAFLSEVLDSILDFFLVALTYISLKVGLKDPDITHMFGHKKINPLIGLVQSVISVILYALIFIKALNLIYGIFFLHINYVVRNPLINILSLIISVCINFSITKYIYKIGIRTRNSTIMAQAINFRGDFLRNISIIIGLFFSNFSLYFLDPIIALFFSILTIIMSLKVAKKCFNELLDYNPFSSIKLDELKNQLVNVEGVDDISELAIKSVGNELEINIKLVVDSELNAYVLNKIGDDIKTITKAFFLEYSCDIKINLASINKDNKSKYYEIFEIVKYLGIKEDLIKEIHNMSLDVLEDLILVQFHAKLPADMTLGEAHKIISSFEQKLKDRIESHHNLDRELRIITHLEPITLSEKIHSHTVHDKREESRQLSQLIKELIDKEIHKSQSICGIKDLLILNEKEGALIYFIITLKADLSLVEVHDIISNLEQKLFDMIPTLSRCVIHSEPHIS
ncbi:MAG: cation diffusion facilitator family transporter [Promethearchaeota archaeon]